MNGVISNFVDPILRNSDLPGNSCSWIELPSNRSTAKVVWSLGVQLWPNLQ